MIHDVFNLGRVGSHSSFEFFKGDVAVHVGIYFIEGVCAFLDASVGGLGGY